MALTKYIVFLRSTGESESARERERETTFFCTLNKITRLRAVGPYSYKCQNDALLSEMAVGRTQFV